MLISDILIFSFASFSMTICNKHAISKTNTPFLIISLQMFVSCFLALCSCKVQYTSSWSLWFCRVPPIIFCMLLTSMIGLQYSSVSSFVVVKSLSPFLIFLMELTSGTQTFSVHKISILFTLFLSVCFYESSNIDSSQLGLILLFANLILMSIDRYVEKLLLDKIDCNRISLTFLNNSPGIVSLPLLLLYGNHRNWYNHFFKITMTDPVFVINLLSSCFIGTLLNIYGMKVQAQVSASFMSVISCLNRVSIIIYGILLHNNTCTWYSVICITCTILCGLYYTHIDIRSKSDIHEKTRLIHEEESNMCNTKICDFFNFHRIIKRHDSNNHFVA